MKHRTRKALAFATVPLVGVMMLGPALALADDGDEREHRQDRIERMVDRREDRREDRRADRREDRREDRRAGMMLEDHGKHRGWMHHSEEARVWADDVFASIKDNDYSDFKNTVSGTPLAEETDSDTFKKLAQASNHIDAGEREQAHEIMKELRDAGYRFKKLFRESLMKLFPKDS
jgi:hypothetical protein